MPKVKIPKEWSRQRGGTAL